MTAICNGTDLSALVASGYEIEYVPQYSGQVTAIDGTDYSAKIRDQIHLRVPFIPLTLDQLHDVLSLFPETTPYVTWTFYDPFFDANRILEMKYEKRSSSLRVRYHNGKEYWDGLTLELWER